MGLLLVLLGALLRAFTPLQPMVARPDRTEHLPGGAFHGTVVCVHSIFQGDETSWPIAQAMARAGFRGVNPRFPGGAGFDQYSQQLVALYKEYAKDGPVYVWGHSMGADLAVASAVSSSDVNATVAAGFPVEGTPPRLLLLVGVWDQLHSVPTMQKHGPTTPLPLADHNAENWDVQGFRAAAAHFGGRPEDVGWAEPFLARGVFAIGLILLVASFAPHPAKMGGAAALLWWFDPFHTASRALLAGTVLAGRRLLSWRQTLAIVSAVAVATVLNAWPNWTAQPLWLLAFPLAGLLAIPTGWMKLASGLSFPVVMALFFIEIRWPGRLLAALLWIPRRFWSAAGKKRESAPVSRGTYAVLALVLVAAGVAWNQVLQAGYLPDPQQTRDLATKLVCLVIVPIAVFLAAARFSGNEDTPSSCPDPQAAREAAPPGEPPSSANV